jgi:hypothetical protein
MRTLNLTRNQLAAFLKDHESIKQFENLFSIVDDIGPKGFDELIADAGTAITKANQALDAIDNLAKNLEYIAPNATLDAIENLAKNLEYRAPDQVNNHVKTDYLDMSTTAPTTGAVGRMRWNDTDGTIDVGLKGGNVNLQLGQEQFIRVVNKTGATLTEAAYQCVRISGAQGQRPKVALAQANNDANSGDTIGLVTETIADNLEGFVTTSGIVRDINTTGSLQSETWLDGDILYLSGTTAGRVTNIKPSAPIHLVIVGYVIHAHATQGKIFVKVDNGYEIDELHNVKITPTVLAGSLLIYDATVGVWKNARLTAGSNIAITNADGSITIATGASITSDLKNNTGRLIDSSVTLTNGAGAAAATMTNGPTAGNPTKWIPINDNGTTRYIPAW